MICTQEKLRWLSHCGGVRCCSKGLLKSSTNYDSCTSCFNAGCPNTSHQTPVDALPPTSCSLLSLKLLHALAPALATYTPCKIACISLKIHARALVAASALPASCVLLLLPVYERCCLCGTETWHYRYHGAHAHRIYCASNDTAQGIPGVLIKPAHGKQHQGVGFSRWCASSSS
jgi:hypothetical protein